MPVRTGRRVAWLLVAAVLAAGGAARAPALTLDTLEPDREWHVGRITIAGDPRLSRRELRAAMTTRPRSRLRPWQRRPVFDPAAFRADLGRLARLYEARGYYQATIDHALTPQAGSDVLDIVLTIEAGPPVTVAAVAVDAPGHVADPDDPPLPSLVPLRPGEVFTEAAYQEGEAALRRHFLDRGFAWATVSRRAVVDLGTGTAAVTYAVTTGPACVFGDTRIEGTAGVDPGLVRRELLYAPGDPFSPALVGESRTRILALGLFRAVQVGADPAAQGEPVVPMVVRVTEGPPRSIKIGVTYNTQDEIGGQVEWRNLNFLGGGRQASVALRGTQFNSFVAARLLQPHVLGPRNRGILEYRQDLDNESTYVLSASQFRPRLERRLASNLSGFVGYRAEYDTLADVDAGVVRALGGVRRDGVLSGPVAGVVWNSADSPLDPRRGGVASLVAEQPGGIWGGDYRFWKVVAEGRLYRGIPWQTTLATRLRIGLSDALGPRENLPLFDRFYAGGQNSVRGYARRELGPLTRDGKPLGGLSLIEGSVEFRRPIRAPVGGAVFLDFGQVSLEPYDVPVGSLRFASGPGLAIDTPVGPLVVFVGFPINPPPGARRWQLTFSVGQFF